MKVDINGAWWPGGRSGEIGMVAGWQYIPNYNGNDHAMGTFTIRVDAAAKLGV
jgi:hypothetical protein